MLRSLVMTRSTSSIETSRSPNHSFMSLTYAANALAPLIRHGSDREPRARP